MKLNPAHGNKFFFRTFIVKFFIRESISEAFYITDTAASGPDDDGWLS
jgi:hypothetical protein